MEDIGELPGEELFLLAGQLELRERGDALHVGDGQGRWHVAIVMQNAECEMQTRGGCG
jgi:hypothetical protein